MSSELLGAGYYKRVYPEAKKPEQQVSLEFREKLDDFQIKGTYYLGKLAHLFFPKNIPEPHMAANTLEGKSIVHADRVAVDSDHEKLRSFRAKNDEYFMGVQGVKDVADADLDMTEHLTDERARDPRVQAFIEQATERGLLIDSGGQNFSIDSDGTVRYLEINPPWSYEHGEFNLGFNLEKMREGLNQLNEGDRADGQRYFNRLLALMNEAKKHLSTF